MLSLMVLQSSLDQRVGDPDAEMDKKQLLPHPPDLPIEERVWRYQHYI
jgi:hypothetical protein